MDQRIIDLYDKFTHGVINRRAFLDRLAVLAGSAAAANALLPMLRNDYAVAATIAESDGRISTQTFSIPGAEELTGYLAKPKDGTKFPAVIVIHENRGLNPHIKDVTRRLAVEGFLALGIDFLSPNGGTPENEDAARDMNAALEPAKVLAGSKAAVAALKRHPNSNGKVGVVGFCWGGGWANALAASDPDLNASVAYYGMQPKAGSETGIHAALLLHYAGLDERINAGIPTFEEALKKTGKTYELYVYEGVNHAFNNDTNSARYNKEAADLSWGRTLSFLRKHLGST